MVFDVCLNHGMRTEITKVTFSNQVCSLSCGDRCDACGFQARVIATTTLGEFWFCGHHWQFHRPAIERVLIRHSEQPLDEVLSRRRINRD